LNGVTVQIKPDPATGTGEVCNPTHADCGPQINDQKHCSVPDLWMRQRTDRSYPYAPAEYVGNRAEKLGSLPAAREGPWVFLEKTVLSSFFGRQTVQQEPDYLDCLLQRPHGSACR
jgi:hypothetical protein